MTFCFHAEAIDEIRAYSHWNRQSLRFYPQDIVDVLPALFDDSYGDNEAFANSTELRRMTQGILIEDKYFEHFYNHLTAKTCDKFPSGKYDESKGYLWPINEDLVYATIRQILSERTNENKTNIVVPQDISGLIRKYLCYY